MQKNKMLLAGLVVNALSACSSSPPKLTEPEGDWVSFEAPALPAAQSPGRQISCCTSPDTKTYTAVSGSVSSARPQLPVAAPVRSPIDLVQSDGKNVPLYQAATKIVPATLTVRLSPDVAKNFRTGVSWTGNDQWPYVLRKMLAANGLEAEINHDQREVVIQYGQKTLSPARPQQTATVKQPVDKASKQLSVFSGPTEPKLLKTPIVPLATEGVLPAPVVKPKPTPKSLPVMKLWTLDKGTTLKTGYSAWVDKETCPVGKGKWLVRWETDTDYPIDFALSFSSANFEDATSKLFNLYRKAQAPLYVSGYRNQCLIVISDKK